MKTLNIVTAILLSIKSFGDAEFSIHDITKDIRKNLNDGEYELGIFGDRIDHDTVKSYFTEITESGLILDDYYTKYSDKGYRVFSLNKATTPAASAQVTPTFTQVSPSTSIPVDVQLIIYKYMKNNGPVTMKQIQSRLKGYHYTCAEIKDFLEKINLVARCDGPCPASKAITVNI